MIFFFLSVASTICLMLVLKLFERFQVQTFPAIVVNYWICVAVGAVLTGRQPFAIDILHATWFPSAMVLGGLFILGFYSVGITLQKFSLAVATIMQKMSLLISIPFGIFIFSDSFNGWQSLGLAFAFAAIFLTNIKIGEPEPSEALKSPRSWLDWGFPILSLVCSGAIESVLRYAEQTTLQGDAQASALFSLVSFGLAGIVGTLFLLVQIYRGAQKLYFRDVLGGFILGFPNYFSIFFLIMAFTWQDKAVILPMFNVTIIGLSVFLGYAFFRERLSALNLFGVALAVSAILLISLA